MHIPDILTALQDGSRWSWPLANANVLGAACAVALILVAVAITVAVDRGPAGGRRTMIAIVTLAGLNLALGFSLAHTLSRGGWLACVFGLVLLGAAGTTTASRYIALAHLTVLLLLIAVVPGGEARASTMYHPGADSSWMIRLDLWRAACIMFHDQALTGIGAGCFADYYNAWFRDPADHHEYVVINEPLAMLTSYGITAGIAYGALGALCWLCWRWSRSGTAPWTAGMGIALVTYLTASIFSCFMELSAAMCWMVAALIAGCAATLGFTVQRSRSGWRSALVAAACSGGLVALLMVGVAYGCGAWLARGEVVRPAPIVYRDAGGYLACAAIGGAPRGARPSGCFVVIPDSHEGLLDVARFLMRPLIQSGYQAVGLGTADPGLMRGALERPVILLAMGTGCQATGERIAQVQQALKPDALILVDAGAVAGSALLAAVSCPILGIHGSRDEFNPSSQAPDWFPVATLAQGSCWYSPPWDRTWNRNFAALVPSLVAWTRSLTASATVQPAAGPSLPAPASPAAEAAGAVHAVDAFMAATATQRSSAAQRPVAAAGGRDLRSLLSHAGPVTPLDAGDWIVVLYRASCAACREEMPLWSAHAHAVALGISPGPPWAFIDVDDHEPAGAPLALPDAAAPHLRIPRRDISTPMFIQIHDGHIIASGASRDELPAP